MGIKVILVWPIVWDAVRKGIRSHVDCLSPLVLLVWGGWGWQRAN